MDISNNQDLHQLIFSFEGQRLTLDQTIPDLSLVLHIFTQSHFEPLAEVNLKHLTLETVFLVALATAKRVSEIHGFSKIVSHTENYKTMTFTFVHGFVAKTQKPSL